MPNKTKSIDKKEEFHKLPIDYQIFLLLVKKFKYKYSEEEKLIMRERIESFLFHVKRLTKNMQNKK